VEDQTRLNLQTQSAMVRTRLAFERTLMSWIRTAIALITFGFSIYKVFSYAQQYGLAKARGRLGPRGFAVIMISLGLVSLSLAIVQHVRHVRTLRRLYADLPVISVGAITAVLFSMLGVLALIAVMLRQ